MMRLALLALVLGGACGKRAPTAPDAVHCATVLRTAPLRNAVGDSVAYFTVTDRICVKTRF